MSALIARKCQFFTHYSVGGVEWEVATLEYAADFPDWAADCCALVESLTRARPQPRPEVH